MSPPKPEKSLRDAYARGAVNGVLMTDRKFGGSDTCATAITLSAGIKRKLKIEDFKLQKLETELNLMKSIKKSFNTNNILNPGTVLDI